MNLKKQIESLLELKEISRRRQGRLSNNVLSRKKLILIDKVAFELDKVTLPEPRRTGSLKQMNRYQSIQLELNGYKSDRDIVKRHIDKHNPEKYKKLLE